MDRRLPIVIAVLGFHVLGLWALQAGLLRRAVELVVPIAVLSDVIAPPAPRLEPAPQRPAPVSRPSQPHPVTHPEPRPVTVTPLNSEPQAPVGVVEPQTTVQAQAPVSAAEPAAPPAPPAPPASQKIELPSSDAAYLRNPKPPYPPLSRRLGEQGTVVVRALVDASGVPTQAEIRTSSGYGRLDQAALQAVLGWRFVPGKRAGVPEAMWINVPMPFRLEK